MIIALSDLYSFRRSNPGTHTCIRRSMSMRRTSGSMCAWSWERRISNKLDGYSGGSSVIRFLHVLRIIGVDRDFFHYDSDTAGIAPCPEAAHRCTFDYVRGNGISAPEDYVRRNEFDSIGAEHISAVRAVYYDAAGLVHSHHLTSSWVIIQNQEVPFCSSNAAMSSQRALSSS